MLTDNSPTAGVSRDAVVDNVSFDVASFVTGTEILTTDGAKRIEELRVGDRVLTADDQYQPIRWIGRKELTFSTLTDPDRLRLIRICAEALGEGLPAHDLIVSPQHRVLIRSKIAKRMFDTPEVLIAAKKLLSAQNISVDHSFENINYSHLLFDKHEIIFAEGCPTESFYPGPEALKSLSDDARQKLWALFPELISRDPAHLSSARKIPSGVHQKTLVTRHQYNNRAFISSVTTHDDLERAAP